MSLQTTKTTLKKNESNEINKLSKPINSDKKNYELIRPNNSETQKTAQNLEEEENGKKLFTIDYFQDLQKMNTFLKSGGCNLLVEKFELTECINWGSSGVFYEGRYKKFTTRKVGMKFLLNNKTSQRKKVRNLHEEVSKHNLLKHKNITSILGYYPVKEDCSCIVMEFAKYGDLSAFKNKLKRKYFPETFVCYVASEILPAIKYIHSMGICHLDIKKENILIDDNLNIKLTDFSISLKYGRKYYLEKYYDLLFPKEQIKLHLAGTNFYMSPEILDEKTIKVKDLNKIDLYSFGVILYNLAFDDFPYYDTKEKKVNQPKNYKELKEIMNKAELNLKNDMEYSKIFLDFLKKILEKDINKRISIDEAMEHPWIKGGEKIQEEREKVYDINKFLFGLLVDNIKEYNDYVFSFK